MEGGSRLSRKPSFTFRRDQRHVPLASGNLANVTVDPDKFDSSVFFWGLELLLFENHYCCATWSFTAWFENLVSSSLLDLYFGQISTQDSFDNLNKARLSDTQECFPLNSTLPFRLDQLVTDKWKHHRPVLIKNNVGKGPQETNNSLARGRFGFRVVWCFWRKTNCCRISFAKHSKLLTKDAVRSKLTKAPVHPVEGNSNEKGKLVCCGTLHCTCQPSNSWMRGPHFGRFVAPVRFWHSQVRVCSLNIALWKLC